jgi:hypothetical protein
VVTIDYEPLARTVSFLVDIQHLREFAKLGEDVRWRLVIEDVGVLLARTWEAWPGPPPSLDGVSRAQQDAVVREHQGRGRTVSLVWSDLEVATNASGMSLPEANLHERETEVVLSGHGQIRKAERFVEFEVTGKAVRWERTDADPVLLADLLRLAEAYWGAFANLTVPPIMALWRAAHFER